MRTHVYCLVVLALLAGGAPAMAQDSCAAAEQAKRAAEAKLATCESKTAVAMKGIAAAEAKVAELTAALKARSELDGFGLLSATAAYGVRTGKAIVDEVKTAAAGAQKGNFVPLKEMFQKATVTGIQTAQSTATFVSSALDKHAPIVRKTCTDASAKVSAAYKQHAAPLPAVQAAEQALSETNSKVINVIASHVKAQPMLSPLDDPTTVQLLAYALLASPLLILLLPFFLGGSKPKATPRRGRR